MNPLIQLAAIDEKNNENSFFPLRQAVVPSEIELETNKPHLLVTPCDIFYLDGLVVEESMVHSLKSLQIKTNFGDVIWNIPFRLILKTSKVNRYAGFVYIIFGSRLFGNTKRGLAPNIHTNITILIEASRVFLCTLITNEQYQLPKNRTILSQTAFQAEINQYSQYQILPNQRHLLRMDHLVDGIFVESTSPVTKYQLILNETIHTNYGEHSIRFHNRLIHNQWSEEHSLTLKSILRKIIPMDTIILIENYCKVNGYLYWFPIHVGHSHNSENLYYTLNASRISKLELFVETQSDEVTAYVKSKNILRTADGVTRLVWVNNTTLV